MPENFTVPEPIKPKSGKKGDLSPRTQHMIERHGVIWFIWALLVCLNWMKTGSSLLNGKLQGNDDYLRLVQIRDWLGGQSWSDLHQYRLNPVDPIVMHWSRISDVIIGVPIKLLTPILGAHSAEVLMMAAYPSVMLLLFLYLAVALTLHLTEKLVNKGHAPLAAVFITALSFSVLSQFKMGRIDHHGLQIVMALACLLCIIKSSHKPKYAIFGGILCGLGLYVGIESAPYIAAACVSIVLTWVFGEINSELRMRTFGLAMAVTTLVSLLLSTPPSRWFVPSCDAISVVYTQLTLSVAILLWGLSFVSARVNSPLKRLCLAGGLAVLALGLTMALFPQCLKGPYAGLDPRLVEIWLSNVSEAGTFHAFIRKDIVQGASIIIVPIFALFGFWLYGRKTGNVLSIAPRSLLIFMVFALLAGLIQTRLMAFSTSFAIPFAAYLLTYGQRWAETLKTKLLQNLARVGLLILLAPITIPILLNLFPNKAPENDEKTAQALLTTNCLSRDTLSKLDTLGAGTALTQIDLGAAILAHTQFLNVTSAPYHRNTQGILAALDMFMGDEKTAKAAIASTQADYVIACTQNSEANLYQTYAPDGFMTQFKNDVTPTWLTKIEAVSTGSLHVYKVKHE